MSESDKTGGPAFPYVSEHGTMGSNGMTLRDYFAAKAMQALVGEIYVDTSHTNMAKEAYLIADAMLVGRDK